MGRKLVLSLLFVIIPMVSLEAAEIVTFKGKEGVTVTAKLTRPNDAKEPFPALILLHGCLGFDKHYGIWAERLAIWGYVALQIDTFGRSEKLSICNVPSRRAQDLCDAKSYLSKLPFVDSNRIGVMGWSQGAASALASFCSRLSALKKENPFRVAVVFYPYCYKPLLDMDLPLLVLAGELDELCPSALWKERIPLRKTQYEVKLKVYPGAYHCFDGEGVNTNYMGHRLKYCPAAANDAFVQVKGFLAKHLR